MSTDSVLRRTEEETQTPRRRHMEMEAETGGTWPQAQGRLEPPELEEVGRPLPGGCIGSAAGTPGPQTPGLQDGGKMNPVI